MILDGFQLAELLGFFFFASVDLMVFFFFLGGVSGVPCVAVPGRLSSIRDLDPGNC